MEDRGWAEGLNQTEFEKEYLNRFPWGSDVIPLVENYIKPYLVEQRGIDKFHLDDTVEEVKIKKVITFSPVFYSIQKRPVQAPGFGRASFFS